MLFIAAALLALPGAKLKRNTGLDASEHTMNAGESSFAVSEMALTEGKGAVSEMAIKWMEGKGAGDNPCDPCRQKKFVLAREWQHYYEYKDHTKTSHDLSLIHI